MVTGENFKPDDNQLKALKQSQLLRGRERETSDVEGRGRETSPEVRRSERAAEMKKVYERRVEK